MILRRRPSDRSVGHDGAAAAVDIELTGSLTLGMTVADFRRPAPADCTRRSR